MTALDVGDTGSVVVERSVVVVLTAAAVVGDTTLVADVSVVVVSDVAPVLNGALFCLLGRTPSGNWKALEMATSKARKTTNRF